MTKQVITVKIQIHAPIEKVWSHWTDPECIKCWNQASDDWHTTKAENDLTVGGKFLSRMEAKDGSFGFDFEGIYNSIEPLKKIEYTLSDGRKVFISFVGDQKSTTIFESFEAENENSLELQELGWQAILNHFKHYSETH